MSLLIISIAPVFIILFYVYFRDKYEKEPISLIIKGLILGSVIVLPIMLVEQFFMQMAPLFTGYGRAAYTAFVVAAFTEEFFKMAAVYLLIWKNPEFNEKFDGIVYAVCVSLGFALVENIMYVFGNGITTGYVRAITAVPAHAIFGVVMGYYLGQAKFSFLGLNKKQLLTRALAVPILFHGIYDFLLMTQNLVMLVIFVPFVIFLYRRGFRRMREHSEDSIFKPKF